MNQLPLKFYPYPHREKIYVSHCRIRPRKEELMSQEALAANDCGNYRQLLDLCDWGFLSLRGQDKGNSWQNGMRQEIDRCQRLLIWLETLAENVGVVSSGDAGVYGMAGLIFKLLDVMT